MNPFSNAYLLLTLAALCWGGNAIAGKLATLSWEPFTITCLRWLLVLVLVMPFTWRHFQRDWSLVRQHWKFLFLLCGPAMGGFNLLMYLALNYTSAINVSIEQAAMPVLIMVANFLFLRQAVTPAQGVGLLLTLAGVLITATEGQPLRFFDSGLNRGDAIMLLASACYAAYSFGLRWRPPMSWRSFILVMSFFVFVTSVPFALWEFQAGEPPALPGINGWLVLVYAALFASLGGQLFFARGVELIGANRAGLFINLVPIFGAVLAVLILGETFRWFHAAGLVLVLSGIALAERRQTSK